MSTVLGDVIVVAGSEHLQSSLDAPHVNHDATTAPTHSPPRESSITNEDSKEPMHLDGVDFGREDPTTLAPTIKEGKTILIDDSDNNDDSQVAPMDVLIGVGDSPI